MTSSFNRTLVALILSFIMMQAITSFIICKSTTHSNRFRFITARGAKHKSGGDAKTSKKSNTAFVSIEYVDSELWKLEPIIDILKKGDVLINLNFKLSDIKSCIHDVTS